MDTGRTINWWLVGISLFIGDLMDKDVILKKIAELDAKLSDYPLIDGSVKSSVGFGATFASMSINDWVGLFVGLATFIYMCLQIEAAWRRRKND